MLLGTISIRDTHLVLEDVNKKDETAMPLEDALTLLHWLVRHQAEIQQTIKALETRERNTTHHDK